MPECAHNLAQAAVYLALAPKSNASYRALGRAREWVREHGAPEPPAYLRGAIRPAGPGTADRPGGSEPYDYPHELREGVSAQELMPPEAVGERFLELSEHGDEADLRARLERIRTSRNR
jgi:putative ATPase